MSKSNKSKREVLRKSAEAGREVLRKSAAEASEYRLLDVRVTRSLTDRSQFQWTVHESNGDLVEASPRSYPTDRGGAKRRK